MKSKQEEIDQFLRFQKHCEKGGYLDGILKGMENYVENQIRNDTAIPIVEYANQNDTRVWEAEHAMIESQKKVIKLEADLLTATNEVLRLQTEIEDLNTTANGYQADLEQEGDRLIAERIKVRNLEGQLLLVKATKFDELLIERKMWMKKISELEEEACSKS